MTSQSAKEAARPPVTKVDNTVRETEFKNSNPVTPVTPPAKGGFIYPLKDSKFKFWSFLEWLRFFSKAYAQLPTPTPQVEIKETESDNKFQKNFALIGISAAIIGAMIPLFMGQAKKVDSNLALYKYRAILFGVFAGIVFYLKTLSNKNLQRLEENKKFVDELLQKFKSLQNGGGIIAPTPTTVPSSTQYNPSKKILEQKLSQRQSAPERAAQTKSDEAIKIPCLTKMTALGKCEELHVNLDNQNPFTQKVATVVKNLEGVQAAQAKGDWKKVYSLSQTIQKDPAVAPGQLKNYEKTVNNYLQKNNQKTINFEAERLLLEAHLQNEINKGIKKNNIKIETLAAVNPMDQTVSKLVSPTGGMASLTKNPQFALAEVIQQKPTSQIHPKIYRGEMPKTEDIFSKYNLRDADLHREKEINLFDILTNRYKRVFSTP